MQHRPTAAAAADAALSTSCSALLGQKAFANYNGLATGLVYCPVPPHGPAPHPTTAAAAAAAAAGARGAVPPPWLAIVVDASMRPASLQHAKEGIAQALLSLPPHTRLLLAVVDKVVSFVDLRSPQAPTWVLHSATSKAAVALPHLVRAADIRATPLSHCLPHLPAALAALRHYPHPCTPQLHLHSIASALDIAIYLLTASMAAWDANQRSKADGGLPNYSPGATTTSSSSSSGAAAAGGSSSSSGAGGGTQPVHSARVLFLTDQQPRPRGAAAAAAATTPMDAKQQQHVSQLFAALGRKADNVDIPIDVITGSPGAASWMPLQDTVITSRGTTLYQPHLAPPLASNLAALATKRVGWEGAIGFTLPRGVKLAELQGPIAPGHPLPLFYPGAQQYGGPSAAAAAGGGSHQHSSSSSAVQANHAAAAGDGGGSSSGSTEPGAGPAPRHSSRSGVARSGAWPDNAVAVPAVEVGSSFLVQLELAGDLAPGSSLVVEAVAQWTDRAGLRQQQASQLQLSVASRRGEFLSGLHHPTALLLLARQLVEGALTAFQKAAAAGRPPAARRKVLEEGALRVGMQLALVAQRLGESHTLRRGLLGWGSQQVWQLPDELVPMAASLYLLQHGPLLGARRPLLFHRRGTSTTTSSTGSREGAAALGSSSYAAGGGGVAPGAAAAAATAVPGGISVPEDEEEEGDEEAAWQLQVYQLLDASPEAAVRLAAPELHVYDPSSAGFKRVLPVSLAITPSALVVVDCGTQLVVYAGSVIRFSNPGATDGGSAAAGGVTEGPTGLAAAAAAAAAGGGGEAMPDVAMVAAPAVQLAQQLAKGRLPVPSIHIIETEEEVDQLLTLLVPLHLDPMATQLLLLPDLRSSSAAEHGQLLQWHKQRHERQVMQQEMAGGPAAAAEVPSLEEWCAALRVGLPVDHEGVASLQLYD